LSGWSAPADPEHHADRRGAANRDVMAVIALRGATNPNLVIPRISRCRSRRLRRRRGRPRGAGRRRRLVTAYDRTPCEPSRFHAFDYLLKPVDDDRAWRRGGSRGPVPRLGSAAAAKQTGALHRVRRRLRDSRKHQVYRADGPSSCGPRRTLDGSVCCQRGRRGGEPAGSCCREVWGLRRDGWPDPWIRTSRWLRRKARTRTPAHPRHRHIVTVRTFGYRIAQISAPLRDHKTGRIRWRRPQARRYCGWFSTITVKEAAWEPLDSTAKTPLVSRFVPQQRLSFR